MKRAAVISPLLLLGCAVETAEAPAPPPGPSDYLGIETRLLDDDLVQFRATIRGAPGKDALGAYAECAAAQYAVIRGYGFARHLRTVTEERGGASIADAVYTISPTLPRGIDVIDAEITLAACQEQGIPTV